MLLSYSQNVSKFAGLVWKADFGHFFGNILGLGAHFSKPIFALKLFDLNTMNPIIGTIFYSPLKGSEPNFGGNSGRFKKLRFG